MSEYKIESNVPLDVRPKHPSAKYPFAAMKVDDSFTVPVSQTTVRTAAKQFADRQTPPWKFTVRKVSDNELRVWRVK